MNQQEMLQKSNELGEQVEKDIQSAFDNIREFYDTCGKVNGMSFKYELVKMYNSLNDVMTLFGKIKKRVDAHINDTTDEDEFRRLKSHEFTSSDNEELSFMPIGSHKNPNMHNTFKHSFRSADDVLSDEQPDEGETVKRLRK